MNKKKGKDSNYSSRKGGNKEELTSSRQKDNNTSRSKGKYEDVEGSQTNESGFKEGGVYLYDPYDNTGFNNRGISPITQGRTTGQTGEYSKSPEVNRKNVFSQASNDLNLKDAKDDELSTLSLKIAKKRRGEKEKETGAGLVNIGEEDPKDGSYIPRKIKERDRSNKKIPKVKDEMSPNRGNDSGEDRQKEHERQMSKIKNFQQGAKPSDIPAFVRGKSKGVLFNETTKVMSLMEPDDRDNLRFLEGKKPVHNVNRLSVVLLNKKSQSSPTNKDSVDFRKEGKLEKAFSTSPGKTKKFSKIANAMIASKGPNCEDRVITKVMRGDDTGGVVDLAVIKQQPGAKKYEVKKFGQNKVKGKQDKAKQTFNPKMRTKAAKCIQGWWRYILSSYEGVEDKVVKLQAVWRGFWYRKYLYDIIYYTYMTKAFVEKVGNPLRGGLKKWSFKILQANYARKYWVRKNLFKIIIIQRLARRFLRIMRDKKKRGCNLIDKFYQQKLNFAFKKLERFSENQENKGKKKQRHMNDLFNRTKRAMRTRIFHELLWRIIICPIKEIQDEILNKTLRFSFMQKAKTNIRRFFRKWFKRSLQLSGAHRPLGAIVIKRILLLSQWNQLIGRFRKFPPRGLKQKFLKRFLKKSDKFSDALCKHFINLWRVNIKKLRVLEFKGEIGQKFLFRSAKKRENREKLRFYKRWRSYVFKVSDIGAFIDGLPFLKLGILRKIWTTKIPKLMNSADGIKGRLLHGMFFSMPKFNLTLLRRYLLKWKKIKAHLGRLEASCQFLKSFKRGHNSKIINRLMGTRFNDWRRKAAMIAYKQEFDSDWKERTQFLATMDLFDAVTRHVKRKAFHMTYPKVKKYLIDVIKSMAVRELFKRFKFLNKICLRKYHNKWKKKVEDLERREMTAKMVGNMMKGWTTTLKNRQLLVYFNRWGRNIPKHTLLAFTRGYEHLEKYSRLKTLKFVIIAMNIKTEKENLEEAMKKGLGFSEKFMKKKWKEFFYTWRNQAERLRMKHAEHEMASKFMTKFTKKLVARLLRKNMRDWWTKRHGKQLTIHQIFMRNKSFGKAIERLVNEKILERRKQFWKAFKETRGKRVLLMCLHRLLAIAINGKKLQMSHLFSRWLDKCKDAELRDLRHQLMRMAVNQELFKHKAKRINSFFHRWKKQVQLLRTESIKEQYLHIYNGILKANALIAARQFFFFTKMKRLMTLDTRGRIIHMLYKRANKPRYNTAHAFERWARRAEEMRKDANLRGMQRKITAVYTKKLTKRMERDWLNKRFRLWRYRGFFSSHVLPDVAKAVPKFNTALKKKYLGLPFTYINRSKNYANFFKKIMPQGSKMMKRWERNAKLKCFKNWVKQKDRCKTNEMKVRLFAKTNGKFSLKMKIASLSRRFRKWKQNAYKRPMELEDVEEGLALIEIYCKRPIIPPFLANARIKAQLNDKNRGLDKLLKKNKGFLKVAKRLKFKRWWKNMLLFDDKDRPRVMRNIRRMFIETYIIGPKEIFFRKWIRAMYLRPVDGKLLREAAMHLRKFFLKKTVIPMGFWWKCRHKVSSGYLEKQMIRKLLPNMKSMTKKQFKNLFWKWKRTADKLAVLQVQAKMMNSLYGKTQKAIHLRFFQEKFRKWAEKDARRPDMNIRDVIRLNNIMFRMLARKYLKGFIPEMKEFSTKRFLRSCLLKQSKYHRKQLLPFFKTWREKYEKLKAKSMRDEFNCKILVKTNKYYKNKRFRDIMRNRFSIWATNAEEMAAWEKEATPRFVKLLKRKNLKENLPTFLKKMHREAMDTLKKRFAFGLTKKKGMCSKRLTHQYWKKWCRKVTELQIKDVKLKLFSSKMKLSETKRKKVSLQRAFEKFKKREIEVPIQNATALQVASKTVKRLLNRRPWYNFKKKTKMMNLKVPYGCTMGQALVNFNPNVCKSIALRNYIARKYFKRWKANVQYEKTKELEAQMFKKLFLPNANKAGRLAMRRTYRMWADIVEKMKTQEAKMELQLGLMKNMYANNSRLHLRTYFKKWARKVEEYYNFLNKVTLGSTKLSNRLKRSPWKQFYFNALFGEAFDKTPYAKKIMLNWLRRTDKGNLFWAFNNWNNKINAIKTLMLKHRIAKNIFTKLDFGEEMRLKNLKIQWFTFWRMYSNKRNFDVLRATRLGYEALAKGMRKEFNEEVFDGINKTAKKRQFVKNLNKLVNKYDDDYKKTWLRLKFLQWKETVEDIRAQLLDDLAKLFRDAVEGYLRDKMIKEPISKLLSQALGFDANMEKAANKINRFLRKSLQNSWEKLSKLKKRKIAYIMESLAKKDAGNLKLKFIKWRFKANMMSLAWSSNKIQNYIREKLENLNRERGIFGEACHQTEMHIRKEVLHKINDEARKRRILQLLLRNMRDVPPELKLKFLRKYWKLWFGDYVWSQNNTAAKLIITMCKRYFAVKLKKKLLAKRFRLNKVILRLMMQYMDQKKVYFCMWRVQARKIATKTGANTILRYLGVKLNNLKKTQAKEALRHQFLRYGWSFILDQMRGGSKINKERGKIMFNTLENIFIAKPFDNIKNSSKWLGRLRKIGDVLPKILKAMKSYYLPYYMRKWRDQAEELYLDALIRIQNMVRAKLILLKKRAETRKRYLYTKMINRATNDETIKKTIFLRFWQQKAQILSMQKASNMIGSIWKGNTSRKNVDRQRKGMVLKKVFKRLYCKMLNRDFLKAFDNQEALRQKLSQMKGKFEKRYTTNNILDYSNNAIRNMLMFKLTKNINYNNYYSTLQRAFYKWRRNTDKLEKNIILLQNNYRNFKARKTLELKKKCRNLLVEQVKRFAQSDRDKAKVYFLRWMSKAGLNMFNIMARNIQSFLRKRTENLRRSTIKNFFYRMGAAQVGVLLSNSYKFKKLRDAVAIDPNRHFLHNLKYFLTLKKLLFLLSRRFSSIDDQLKNLYIKKYLLDWRNQAKKLTIAREASALLINSVTRGFLVRKWINPILEKKKVMLKIRDRFLNMMGLKFQVYFLFWANIVRQKKAKEAANVIQIFSRFVKNKAQLKKNNKLQYKVTQGVNKLQKRFDKANIKKAFAGIKKLAELSFYAGLIKFINKKAKNYKQHALQKMKDYLKIQENCASFIQKTFRDFLFGRKIGKVLYKIRRLRWILTIMSDRDARFRHKCIIEWQKRAHGLRLHVAAQDLQLFLKQSLLKYRKAQRRMYKAKFKKFSILNVFLRGNLKKYARLYNTHVRLTKVEPLIFLYIFKRFKKKCLKWDKLKNCSLIYNFRQGFIKRLLKKRFIQWAGTSNNIKLFLNILKLQKAVRRFIRNLRLNRLRENMNNILKTLAKRYSDKKSFYFNYMYNITKKLQIKEAVKSLSRFTMKYLKRHRLHKKWLKWGSRMCKYQNSFDLLDILERVRQWKVFRVLLPDLHLHLLRPTFEDFKNRVRTIKVCRFMQMIFGNFEKRLENLTKLGRLRLWLKKTRGFMHIDETILNGLDAIHRRRVIGDTATIGDFYIYKKLIDLAMTVRCKIAFKALKDKRDRQIRITRLFELLKEADEDCLHQNIEIVKKNNDKIYTYRILSTLVDRIRKIDNKYYMPKYQKFLITRLALLYFSGSLCNYQDIHKEKPVQREYSKLSFSCMAYSLSDTPKEKGQQQEGEGFGALALSGILRDLIRQRYRWGWIQIMTVYKGSKLSEDLKKYAQMKIPKFTFFKDLRQKYLYRLRTPSILKRFRRMLRKYTLVNWFADNTELSRRLRLRYLLQLCLMEGHIARMRRKTTYIRRWLYKVTISNVAKEKMMTLYKNMHLQFLNTTNDMFADDETGLFNELQTMQDKFNTFKTTNKSSGHFKKQYCKGGVSKRYKFTSKADQTEEDQEEENLEEEQLEDEEVDTKSKKHEKKR
ncbi:MAG: hypothetical protein GY861_17730 [bacterium]|nr:hypothetical protein [bacterium]